MKPEESDGTLDLAIEKLGQWRKHNIYTYILLFVPALFTGTYESAYVFITGDIDYRCQVPECESLGHSDWIPWAIPSNGTDKCNRYYSPYANISTPIDFNSSFCAIDVFDKDTTVKCDQYVYDTDNTIVREFDLGCQDWKRTLVGTLHNAGYFISIGTTGIFSDRFGRKTCVVVGSLINSVIGLIRSFSTSYVMLAALEFLQTALGGGLYLSTLTLLIEIVVPKNRVTMNASLNVMFATGLIIPAILSWLIKDWRTILRIIHTPTILVIVYIWILDESARWLLARNRKADACNILRKMAKASNVELSDLLVKLENKPDEDKVHGKQNNIVLDDLTNVERNTTPIQVKSKLKRVLTSRVLISRVSLSTFFWITCTFTYYGLSINSVSLTGNKYLNYILVCLVEIPSHLSGIFIMDRIGRRRTLNITFLITGLCCTAIAFIPKELSILALIIYLLGKCSITLAFACLYVFVSEVFPTDLRQSLIGCCSTLGRFGSLVAPQVPLIAKYVEFLPNLLFGLMALASALLSLTVPETRNSKLPDTIEEAERITGEKRKLSVNT